MHLDRVLWPHTAMDVPCVKMQQAWKTSRRMTLTHMDLGRLAYKHTLVSTRNIIRGKTQTIYGRVIDASLTNYGGKGKHRHMEGKASERSSGLWRNTPRQGSLA